MKKIVIINGLIAGAITATLLFISLGIFHDKGNFEGGMIFGYASMLLAFSLIFVAITRYRNNYNNGVISFGKAFRIGLYITLIASTVYVAAWLIDYYVFMPDFADKYAVIMLDKLKSSGATAAEIAKQTKEMDNFKVLYKNPVMVILFTYIEILPVGLLVTLIASLVLKRKGKPAVSA